MNGFKEKTQKEDTIDLTNQFPILKQIIPFTRTPMNLMLNVVDRTPLGFLRQTYRDDFFGRMGVERMAQARGQLATGFALTMLANKLVAEGAITGSQGQIAHGLNSVCKILIIKKLDETKNWRFFIL